MTLYGAIKQLHELRTAEDMPIYYKPIIAEVINVLLMDAQEEKHGKWIHSDNGQTKCSICGSPIPIRKVVYDGEVMWEDNSVVKYCPNCGAKMEEEKEE